VAGTEEKRAFTLVVGVSASDDVLPFQAIYKGKTSLSLPAKLPQTVQRGLLHRT